ncbi:hypothetical protein K8I85_12265, partial [bacterium]|nr:hypothetical protein [bacterium]
AVPSAGPVRLDVYDVRGAHLAHRDLGVLGAGPGAAIWNRETTPLPAGMYFLRVSGAGWSAAGRAQLLK